MLFFPQNKHGMDKSETNEIGYAVNCLPELDVNGVEEMGNDMSLRTFYRVWTFREMLMF